MGPFPHDAPHAVICDENPAGTDGFEFVEFAHPDPDVLRDLFSHREDALEKMLHMIARVDGRVQSSLRLDNVRLGCFRDATF